MEYVAHRAGNLPDTVAGAVAVADTIELDVHLFRGRLEVRHEKVFWPFALRWEKWHVVPPGTPRPTLDEVLARVPRSTHVWFDLKGFHRGLTRRVLAATDELPRRTVSTRSWWILGPARARPDVRAMRSAGNRVQRWLAVRTTPRARRAGDGVVIHERLADPPTVARLRRAGTVIVWATTTRRRIEELARLGVDGVIVDDLGLIDHDAG